jgi:aspartate kinase
VLHDRSVELAEKFGVPVQVLTSFGDTPGTTMSAGEGEVEGTIGGLACDRKLLWVHPAPGHKAKHQEAMAHLHAALASKGCALSQLFADVDPPGFALRTVDLPETKLALKSGEFPCLCIEETACISLVGYKLGQVPRLEAKAKQLLRGFGIKIKKAVVTDDYISVYVAPSDADEAMRVLHDGMAIGVGAEHGDKAAKAKRRRS